MQTAQLQTPTKRPASPRRKSNPSGPTASNELATVTGTIKTMSRAYNAGWRILEVSGVGTVTGVIPDGINVGDHCAFTGTWQDNRHGHQFAAIQVVQELPRDARGIRDYLDRFRHCGPVVATRMIEAFGTDNVFRVIEHEPERLAIVDGITPARALQVHEEFMAIKTDLEQDVFFSTHGISPALRNRLIDTYQTKDAAIAQINANPYILADEVWGVGFKSADKVALSTGIKKDSRRRLTAGVEWVLHDAAQGEGHVCLPRNDLIFRAATVLEGGGEKVAAVIEELIAFGKLVVGDGDVIYLKSMHDAESYVASKLLKFSRAHHTAMIHEMSEADLSVMDADQRLALDYALKSKILVITGGPGVGKTYTINQIIRALGKGTAVEMAAPTGRAAKRMKETTGLPAQTLHRLLAFHPQDGFRKNESDPVEADTIIVDESSMIDVELMAHFLRAVDTKRTQLIFVGDVNQLPSVGPGRVLGEMIESGIVPVVWLKTLHRQASESYINRNAQNIIAGSKLDFPNSSAPVADFFFVPCEERDSLPEMVEAACVGFARKYAFSLHDIQILCPQKKGPAGTVEMNKRMRKVINGEGAQIRGTTFFIGDKVIQTKNNYRLEVFNGDVGIVMGGDSDSLFVDMDGTTVEYPKKDVDQLQLAYALTVHKSQGSEFSVVVMPVHSTNHIMLVRNLLYTAITRAKRYVVLVGTHKAINIAIKTVDNSNRHTCLAKMMKEGFIK